MSDIIVADDQDLKLTLQAREMAATVGTVLARTYPGYRWRIEPHAHPTRPFVDFEPEIGLMGTKHGIVGATVVLSDFYSSSSLEAKIKDLAGQLLELGLCNRRAFDEAEFLSRPKNFAGMVEVQCASGIILPAGA